MNKYTEANRRHSGLKLTAAPLALILLMSGSYAAYAAVTNTVTATGTGPSGPPGGVSATANESVDVVDDTPAINVVRNWSFVSGPTGDVNGNTLADAGDQIFYTYVVTNSGNVTLADVNVSDVHEATGAVPAPITPTTVTTDNGSTGAGTLNDSSDVGATADGDWDILGPADVITFTSGPYTVAPGDIVLATSLADDAIDGTVSASGSYDPGAAPIAVSGSSSAPVPLNIVPSLTVAKVASPDTNVPAGTTVTYTYTITNTGPVPITNVALADSHNGSGPAPVPGSETIFQDNGTTNDSTDTTANDGIWSVLAPGDLITMTGTYVVTQSDVDTLQ